MILVTGASGLLGANLAALAARRRIHTVAVYNQHPVELSGVTSVQADLTDRAVVQSLLSSLGIEWIIHCAALTNLDWCEDHPEDAHQVNAQVPANIAACSSRLGIGLVYISTDSVFDGRKGGYTEDDLPNPVNVYAASKLAGERAVQQMHPSSLVIRTNIYGWNVRQKLSLSEWILRELKAGRVVPGFSDVFFTPLLTNQLSEIILTMIEHGFQGLYHLGSSDVCSKYQFARQLARTFGFDEELVQPTLVQDSHLRTSRPRNTSLMTSRISQALGRECPTIASGLQQLKILQES